MDGLEGNLFASDVLMNWMMPPTEAKKNMSEKKSLLQKGIKSHQ